MAIFNSQASFPCQIKSLTKLNKQIVTSNCRANTNLQGKFHTSLLPLGASLNKRVNMILVKELNQRKNKIFYIVVICLTDVKECEVAQKKCIL